MKEEGVYLLLGTVIFSYSQISLRSLASATSLAFPLF